MRIKKMQNLQDILKKCCRYIVIVTLISIYILLVHNYVNNNICLSRGSFLKISVFYALIALALYNIQYWRKTIKVKLFLEYGNLFLFLMIPICAFYIVEVIYNPFYCDISLRSIVVNYFIFMALELGIYLLSNNVKMSFCLVLSLAWIFGIANYYVLQFKGNPLLPSDLLSYRTAMSVADNYSFDLSDAIVNGFLLYLFVLCIILYVPQKNKILMVKRKVAMLGVGILQVALFVFLVININLAEILDVTLDAWDPKNTYYKNGALFTFVLETQSMIVSRPDDYSRKEVCEILNHYNNDNDLINEETVPSVIVIMNESFSDLGVIGEFQSDPLFENMNNMTYVMKGNVYASVMGGGTCNSEFEFLTGNSMANFSGNVYPYQMYDLKNVPNLAAAFLEQGYETIAMHPAQRNNWNRNNVYAQLGFQKFISLENMQDLQAIRWYASDASNYQQIINEYENKNGPIFIFNVTMQNHGGYDSDLAELDLVNIEKKYRKFKDVVKYLTLVKESDRAFGELISYFSKVEEPVIICMFGDHQPAIDEEFVSNLQGQNMEGISEQQKRLITPYIVWCNYDTEIQNINKDMSLNYLGAQVLNLAGIKTDYTSFLLDIQENIPVINKLGYQTSDGEWYSTNIYNEIISQYRNMQYYMLFDNE